MSSRILRFIACTALLLSACRSRSPAPAPVDASFASKPSPVIDAGLPEAEIASAPDAGMMEASVAERSNENDSAEPGTEEEEEVTIVVAGEALPVCQGERVFDGAFDDDPGAKLLSRLKDRAVHDRWFQFAATRLGPPTRCELEWDDLNEEKDRPFWFAATFRDGSRFVSSTGRLPRERSLLLKAGFATPAEAVRLLHQASSDGWREDAEVTTLPPSSYSTFAKGTVKRTGYGGGEESLFTLGEGDRIFGIELDETDSTPSDPLSLDTRPKPAPLRCWGERVLGSFADEARNDLFESNLLFRAVAKRLGAPVSCAVGAAEDLRQRKAVARFRDGSVLSTYSNEGGGSNSVRFARAIPEQDARELAGSAEYDWTPHAGAPRDNPNRRCFRVAEEDTNGSACFTFEGRKVKELSLLFAD